MWKSRTQLPRSMEQSNCSMASQSQSGGDEEGQQEDELAGQGGESEQAEGQGEQQDVDGMVEGRSARERTWRTGIIHPSRCCE